MFLLFKLLAKTSRYLPFRFGANSFFRLNNIINNMTITSNGFGYIKITDDVINEFKVDAGTASNMVNDLNFIKELKVWAFSSYDEKLDLYKINIRSRGIVINEIASHFNGGGHKFASGARIKTEEEVNELFKCLDEACKEEE